MKHLPVIQQKLAEMNIDGWLLYDFRGNNPILAQIFGMELPTTRRMYLSIPQDGKPVVVASVIDESQVKKIGVEILYYHTWQEMHELLQNTALVGMKKVAMEYSPGCTIPVVSLVDAGSVDKIRDWGIEVVSSANIAQYVTAQWSDEAYQIHKGTARKVACIKDEAFDLIFSHLREKKIITDVDVMEFIRHRFANEGLKTPTGPIVATNERSGDPHFEPNAAYPNPIHKGDWILIDLWARVPGNRNIFSDITWVGYAGENVPQKHQEVFDIVTGARDQVVEILRERLGNGEQIQGWELDQIARDHIAKAGYGDYFIHRTGHSIGPGHHLHCLGVNLDNYETHDTRLILPKTGFSVEPGIYLPEFGVRSEIDVYISQNGVEITSPIQQKVITM
ncbi:M24 family metallopeptidase [bacterium]|nr:M24 family metallopeptidase [bacterium]